MNSKSNPRNTNYYRCHAELVEASQDDKPLIIYNY